MEHAGGRDPGVRGDLLRIYLNDHRAGAAFGLRLAQRCAASNRGTPLGDLLSSLIDEIREDRDVLEQVMRDLGYSTDRLKMVAAEVAERMGRLKPNGSLLGYSDLSRLIELEGLSIGIEAKANLWRALRRIAGCDARLSATDFDRLVQRATSQRERLEHHRLQASERALCHSADQG